MALLPFNRKRDEVLNDFAKKYRDRSITYLRNTFLLSKEDSEDVFQEASIILYQAAVDGKLDNLASSLYTYFIGICNNKAHEQIREMGKMPLSSIDSFYDESEAQYKTILNKADRILNMIDSDDNITNERCCIARDMVDNMPSPCNEILWSYYRDTLSMKTIAQMFNYANENAAKVTKHRCMEKFRKCYESALSKM